MIGAGVPCPGDPLVTCSAGGGSWWPLIVAAVLFAGWIGFRFGRYGGGQGR